VSCAFSREALALHVEGDLSDAAADITSSHLATCGDCRRFLEQLHARQSLLKSLRRETVSPAECTGMRREVMSIINERVDRSGWALRIERAIFLGFRRHSYALAVCGLLGIVSVSVLAQVRYAAPATRPSVPVFEGRDTLVRPAGYRDWIVVGRSAGPHRSSLDEADTGVLETTTDRVYINPAGFREYSRTGRFPEGTLMVWESFNRAPQTAGRPHDGSPRLLASVKDSTRFDGGWGFFDFTGSEGAVTSKARALPESAGCRTCHRQEAETDHVFTQFYPVLYSAVFRAPWISS
jgi:hypothetical protein